MDKLLEKKAQAPAREATEARRNVFIVGCGRSGTTWLKLLLAQHPGVATSPETRLFSRYISSLDRAWQIDQAVTNGTGLASIVSEERFTAYCSAFANSVLNNILARNPNAEVILEKTPMHARHVPLILKMIPDAFILHIVRDPRSVVASLRAASRSFGRAWAPRSVVEGVDMWRESVTGARATGSLTGRYKEIRYEDLLSSTGPSVLNEILTWLKLETDPASCERAIDACKIEKLRKVDSSVLDNTTVEDKRKVFFRKGRADSWREELSPRDVRIIECRAADLMRQYGYEVASNGGVSPRKPARLLAYDVLDGLEWRVNRGVARFFSHMRSMT